MVNGEAITHTQIQRSVAVQLFGVRQVRILRAGVVHARGSGQAINRFDVILCAQNGIEIRNANRIITLVEAVVGFGQLRLQPGSAGVQTDAQQGLAEHIQLHAAVTLLGIKAIMTVAVEDRRRHFDLKQRQGAAHATKIRLHAHFVLLRVNDAGALPVVGGGVGSCLTRLQRFGVVGIQGDRLPRLVNHAVGRHPAAAVEAVCFIFLPGNFVVSANDHLLMTRPGGKQQFVVQHAQRITQQPALRPGTPAGERIAVISA